MLEEAEWTPPEEFDEYRIVRQLGRGSMGSVYLARDVVLDRPVAMKFLGALRPDPAERERFLVEARAVARIHHPNVMSIFRVGEVKGRLYLVTEYVRGDNLADLDLPLPWSKVLEIGIGLARALGAAHRQGVLHRDIKLSNAVIEEGAQVKLLDFGLAKLVDSTVERKQPSASGSHGSPVNENTGDLLVRAATNARQMVVQRLADTMKLESTSATAPTPKVNTDNGARAGDEADGGAKGGGKGKPGIERGKMGIWSGRSASITRAGTVMGTPHYMAPELWLADPASRRSDVYALGVILYILAAGRPPHDAESPFELAMQVQERDPPPLLDIAEGVDPRLAAVIDRCLARDPYERPASGDELRAALDALAIPERAATAVPTGNPYRGLQAFQAEHRSLFFGRSAEVRSVVERLRTDSFVVVAGDSGVGKSSLCRAGVIPAVIEGELDASKSWRTVTMTPGRFPRQSFVSVIARGFGLTEDEVSDLLSQEPELLVRALRKQLGDSGGCLVFLDQFEEFVTIAEASEVEVIGPMIVRLLAGIPGLRVLATVRGDFLTRVVTVPGLGDEVSRGIFLLRPLSPEGAREAIVGPAKVNGVRFESEELIDELVEAGVKGSLPLLQFALAELWESRDKSASVITEAELRTIGGVTGALARHADGVLASLLPVQRQAARRLLMRLVTLDNTRASLTEDELVANDEASKAALDALVRGRLLVVREAGERMVYEIAHEALVGGWAQLAGWLIDEQEVRAMMHRLEQAAAEWERLGQGREGLWSLPQVVESEALDRSALRGREVAFLERSEANAIRSRNLRRVGIFAVPVLVILAYGVFWLQSRRDLDAKVGEHVRSAEEASESASEGEGRLKFARSEALARFDTGDRDGGEALWEDILAMGPSIASKYLHASQQLETALALDSERADVRRALAELLYQRVRFSDEQGESELVPDLLARLELHDTSGRWMSLWESPGRLRVMTHPAADSVRVAKYEEAANGEFSLSESAPLAMGADGSVELPRGSYLLMMAKEGYDEVLYPVLIGRGEDVSVDVQFAKIGSVPENYVYIPAGRFLVGYSGNEDLRRSFYETVPLHQSSTGSFLISRYETSIADYLEFLNDLEPEERQKYSVQAEGAGIGDSLTVSRGEDDVWVIEWRFGGESITAREGEPFHNGSREIRATSDWGLFPIAGISASDSRAYLAWLDRTGRLPGARFCTEEEWERAARGADGRLYPHGNHLKVGDANVDSTYGHRPPAMGLDTIGSYPATKSPVGVYDASGNVFEWVQTKNAGTYLVKGGSFYFPAIVARSINRQVFPEETRSVHVGLRVCADYVSSRGR